jgi:hypothetical protein
VVEIRMNQEGEKKEIDRLPAAMLEAHSAKDSIPP